MPRERRRARSAHALKSRREVVSAKLELDRQVIADSEREQTRVLVLKRSSALERRYRRAREPWSWLRHEVKGTAAGFLRRAHVPHDCGPAGPNAPSLFAFIAGRDGADADLHRAMKSGGGRSYRG
jgi:hypothetical protein